MKLSKDQIRFIDRYLIKNEVKFWDVRLELLDHIVSSVEDKITNEDISFEQALLQVHRGFGNQLIRGRISQHNDWSKGLYQANNGFKKFTRTKQKEIGKKHRRIYWSSFPKFLLSTKFILEFVSLIILVFSIYQLDQKVALIVLLVICYLVEFSKLFYAVFNKSCRRSLQVQLSAGIGSVFFSFSYFMLAWFGSFYQDISQKPYVYLIVLFLFLFPFMRHGFNRFRQILVANRTQYKLLLS